MNRYLLATALLSVIVLQTGTNVFADKVGKRAGIDPEDPMFMLKQQLLDGAYNEATSPTMHLYLTAALQDDPELFTMLKEAGADINASDAEGRYNALHYTVMMDDAKTMQRLLAAGADPNARPTRSPTFMLYEAVALKSDAIVSGLLAGGANPNQPDLLHGYTPLTATIMDSHTTHTQMLIDAGADPNLGDEGGRTPLHLCATKGKLVLGEMLLKAGADPNQRTKAGVSAYDAARKNRQYAFIALLEKYCAEARTDEEKSAPPKQ